MKKHHSLALLLPVCLVFSQALWAQEAAFRKHLDYLASDALHGRQPGTAGDTLAATYIYETLLSYGYKPMVNDGLQPFRVRDSLWTFNVPMIWEGSDPQYTKECIIIGAHYDHLGMGGPGKSRQPDTLAIHPGADDNASGVAMMLEIAKHLATQNPKRTVIAVAFGAEELGIVGSKYFIDHFPDTMPKPVIMFNLDMVGRLNQEHHLEINGTGTFTGAENILKSVPNPDSLRFSMIPGGFGPSDHTAFYGNNIPVLYFSTGVHYDYHTPTDKIEKINFSGMEKVHDYILHVVQSIMDNPTAPEYQKVDNETSVQAPSFTVTLGIIPDFNNLYEGDGMRADFVTAGKPADKAGMKNGDIILQIGDKAVHNIQSYMECLAALRAGETVSVLIKRGEEILNLIVNL